MSYQPAFPPYCLLGISTFAVSAPASRGIKSSTKNARQKAVCLQCSAPPHLVMNWAGGQYTEGCRRAVHCQYNVMY